MRRVNLVGQASISRRIESTFCAQIGDSMEMSVGPTPPLLLSIFWGTVGRGFLDAELLEIISEILSAQCWI